MTTLGDIIKGAYHDAGVVYDGGEPSDVQMKLGLDRLNLILGDWGNENIFIDAAKLLSFSIVSGTQYYYLNNKTRIVDISRFQTGYTDAASGLMKIQGRIGMSGTGLNVTLKSLAGGTYAVTTDYTYDSLTGIILKASAGAIAADTDIEVVYDNYSGTYGTETVFINNKIQRYENNIILTDSTSTNYPVKLITSQEDFDSIPYKLDTGRPIAMMVETNTNLGQDKISLYPVPDQTYTVGVRVRESFISNPNDFDNNSGYNSVVDKRIVTALWDALTVRTAKANGVTGVKIQLIQQDASRSKFNMGTLKPPPPTANFERIS